MITQTEELWKEIFKSDFEAKVISNNDDTLHFTFGNKNGSHHYFMDFIVVNDGRLIISGDLEYAIADWHGKLTPRNMAKLMDDWWYFTEKIETSTVKYEYIDEYIIDDIEEWFEQVRPYKNKYEEKKDLYELLNYVSANHFCSAEPIVFDDEHVSIIEKYYVTDDINYDLARIWGRRIAKRVKLWCIGFIEAINQLDEKGELKNWQ